MTLSAKINIRKFQKIYSDFVKYRQYVIYLRREQFM